MTDQKHLDGATLDMLQEVLEDGFAGLLETFIVDSRQKIDTLKIALDHADADLIRRNAHSLKGSSSNLGAVGLVEITQRMEEQARAENLAGLNSLLKQLDSEFQAVESIMRQKLEGLL
ncbi:Hpt domain-containing protein [Proteobacteria bacterium 005FR1]|nr:Hpt domain-containing protein [Proteobacteria bacterium 005FR1]